MRESKKVPSAPRLKKHRPCRRLPQVKRYLKTAYELDPVSGNFKPPSGPNCGGIARSASGSYLTPAPAPVKAKGGGKKGKKKKKA